MKRKNIYLTYHQILFYKDDFILFIKRFQKKHGFWMRCYRQIRDTLNNDYKNLLNQNYIDNLNKNYELLSKDLNLQLDKEWYSQDKDFFKLFFWWKLSLFYEFCKFLETETEDHNFDEIAEFFQAIYKESYKRLKQSNF